MSPRLLAALALVALVCGCRNQSDIGDFQPPLDGASQMARHFWMEVHDGRFDAAERRLASETEIAAALRVWAIVMDESFTDENIAREARETSERLRERWKDYRSGKVAVPANLTEEMIRTAPLLVTNKMVLGPDVSYIQRLSLTGPGFGTAGVRVAGAVQVGKAPWKILWLP